jgi:zinc transport system substrate-binding protein
MKILSASVIALLGASLGAQAETPSVATDIAPVHSLVAQVMEGVGAPNLLMQPGVSPHGYALRPSEARMLQSADLVVWIGPELTPSLEDTIETLAGDTPQLMLLDAEPTVRFNYRHAEDFEIGEEDGHDDHADHDDHDDNDDHAEHDDHADHDDHAEQDGHDDHDDHAEHDDHAHDHDGTDAHAWLDPENARIWLGLIAAALSEIDPENANTYAKNADAAQAKLGVLILETDEMLEPLEEVEFVVFHDAYQYFERRFHMHAAGALRDGDGMSPSAARLRDIRNMLKDHDIHCIFSEPQFNDDVVAAVAEGLEIHVSELDPIGVSHDVGADLYGALISGLAQNFASCLSSDH